MSFSITDSVKTVSVTMSGPLTDDNQGLRAWLQVLFNFNAVTPVSSAVLTSGNVLTFTTKDGRTMAYTITVGAAPTYNVTVNLSSSNTWAFAELDYMKTIVQLSVVLEVGAAAVTAYNVTYS